MDYAIFREELALKYSSYGHALWKPSPEGRYPAVEVGDVGFIHEGYFHRLFNILLPRDDPSHPDGVPPGHEQLKLNINSPTNYTGTLQPNHLRSNGVSDTSDVDRRFVQDPDAAARLYFSCSNRRGALLSLPVPAQRQDTAVRREFTKFIIKHIDEWFAFAQGLGFGIHRREDIILVTGRDLTRSWANIAFQERDQKMSFGVQASRGSDVQWQFTPEGAGGVAFNLGPSGQDLPENQCIFVRGIRVSRITRIFPRLLGAAGPSQIPGDDDTESDAQPISIPANVDTPFIQSYNISLSKHLIVIWLLFMMTTFDASVLNHSKPSTQILC
ncbi:hypothetical protein F5148DRAFT_852942 [Russula earlei]|uniref:Uncharacterized protein n=1 Tax=Russula earlei TaxID=71964 RepID=A0ACC0ULG5_9AGAM|nr:hypothetical protein F5148DRAFT_852942 [Russula earlei]